MKKEPKKKMTIENLAAIVSKGFIGVQEKFDNVQENFKEVHSEIENLAIMVGRGFDDVHNKFVEVHKKMDKGFADVNLSLEQVRFRLMSVEDNQLDLKLRMDVLSQNNKGTDELRGRVVVLEKKVGVKGR